ncbi:HCLS1-associated protein X-1 isoform X2 [Dunckerocampus dactyliophorus]|uniref:HCLS1-associated protein X-1 isoform X2 n=1 Tax=Dunckerocampus dactyliophorus TaxID=161453 RepID=UPI0024053662|nr:HCLS1-associated protein X-1 isoform X2 [Dunckerocampus dactyliophorus]
MSVFDLFRGFFGVPGGHYRGRSDPFFDAMTRDEDDDEDDYEDGFDHDGFRGFQQDPFDSAWRFGFSFGPDGMRIQEPPMFGHVLREMEEMFSQLGRWESMPDSDIPSITPPPQQDRPEKGRGGNPLRDFMLKSPNSDARGSRQDESPQFPNSPFHGSTPFSKFNDVWRQRPQKVPEDQCREDRDLDSAVSSGGLDQILSPPAGQMPRPHRNRSFFQSVTVTKVMKPDGTVEERRTIKDGQGNEETTVTRSGGPRHQDGPEHQIGPALPGAQSPFSDMRDDDSFFSKLFGGLK